MIHDKYSLEFAYVSKNALNYKLHSENYLEAVNQSDKEERFRDKSSEEFSNANVKYNRSEMLQDLSRTKLLKKKTNKQIKFINAKVWHIDIYYR